MISDRSAEKYNEADFFVYQNTSFKLAHSPKRKNSAIIS